MSIKDVETAIQAHLDWLTNFEMSMKGVNRDKYDVDRAHDHTACVLGKWLLSPESKNVLSEEDYAEVVSIHQSFHQHAGSIADQINNGQSCCVTKDLILQFNSESRKLIMLLLKAKRQL